MRDKLALILDYVSIHASAREATAAGLSLRV